MRTGLFFTEKMMFTAFKDAAPYATSLGATFKKLVAGVLTICGINSCARPGSTQLVFDASPDGHPNSPTHGHLKLPHLN